METLARMIADLVGVDVVYGYLAVGILFGVLIGAVLVRPRGGAARGEIGGGMPSRISASDTTRVAMRAATPSSFELEINGQRIDVDPQAIAQIRQLLSEDKKVEAIKVLREATGLGLKESKDLVEMMERTAALRSQ